MTYEYFKDSDTDESVLDLDEIFLRSNDKVQSFNTRWDEAIIAMKKQPSDEEILENVVLSSPSTVRTAKAIAVSAHSRYCSKE